MVLFKLSQLKDNVKYNLESLTVVWRERRRRRWPSAEGKLAAK